MWQTFVAGLIVVASAAYVLWALLPSVSRLRLARRLAASVRRSGRPRWLVRAGTALERAASRGAGGCSECKAVRPEPGRSRRMDKP
jgi:hypothetical protein